jgi:hypothetical protein
VRGERALRRRLDQIADPITLALLVWLFQNPAPADTIRTRERGVPRDYVTGPPGRRKGEA